MPVVRLIHVTVKPEQKAQAEKVWKEECAPLMIKSPGCLSEELLKCLDEDGEYISYSQWESPQAIEAYRKSPAHDEIKSHTEGLQDARAVVKRYDIVG